MLEVVLKRKWCSVYCFSELVWMIMLPKFKLVLYRNIYSIIQISAIPLLNCNLGLHYRKLFFRLNICIEGLSKMHMYILIYWFSLIENLESYSFNCIVIIFKKYIIHVFFIMFMASYIQNSVHLFWNKEGAIQFPPNIHRFSMSQKKLLW